MSAGRPSKLTPEIARAITEAVSIGLPISLACAKAEIDVGTVSDWVRRGEDRHTTRPPAKRYVEFAVAIKKARADDQARRVARIQQAARGGQVVRRTTVTKSDGSTTVTEHLTEPQWTADAWHLERSDPENWGRKDRHEVTGQGGGVLVVKVVGGEASMGDL